MHRPAKALERITGSPGGGLDPVAGLMTALSRNPAAATEFFDPKPSHPGAERNDTLSYLLEDRQWPKDYNTTDTGGYQTDSSGKAALGNAVEAAATGHPPNGQPQLPTELKPHTPEQQAVMQEMLTVLGGRDHLNGAVPAELRVNAGNVIAEYLLDNPNDPKSLQQQLVTPADPDADRAFLKTLQGVAHDPEAYATVAGAEKRITAEVLAANPPTMSPSVAPGGKPSYGIPDPVADVITAQGTLTGVRNQAIAENASAEMSEAFWNRRYQYHITGGILNYSPVIPDPLQRYMDVQANFGLDQDSAPINQQASDDKFDNYWTQRAPVNAVTTEWAENNGITYDDINDDVDGAFTIGTKIAENRNP